VADEAVEGVRALRTETLMDTADARRRVAERILQFAQEL
jgi:hypothetical protein